ncbi:MAG: calcium-binding protein [Nostoc sp.]|uniref:calcium-binding protein n=1 Tax=Nostoc sp. TaxID=1180 RepID=UPI002FF4B908
MAIINGTNANDILNGLGSNDSLYGFQGDDVLHISNSSGKNLLDGGSDNDRLYATATTGINTLKGGSGDDYLDVSNSSGKNLLEGGSESDQIYATATTGNLITNSDYKPCLVVDFQSSYHDYPKARERDRKKATLLALAAVPLLYSRVKDCGLLHLYSQFEEVVCNLFTGNQRENAQALIRRYCEQSFSSDIRVTGW